MVLSEKTLQHFPPLPQFSHFMKPSRFEGETNYLEVIGRIPPEVQGTFYRVMPDPHLPSRVENDPVSTAQFCILGCIVLLISFQVVQR